MRINYKNYPVLKFIVDGKLPIDNDQIIPEKAHTLISELFGRNVIDCRRDIFTMSKEFIDSAEKAESKLSVLYKEIIKDSISNPFFGSFIRIDRNIVSMVKVSVTLGKDFITVLSFDKDGHWLFFDINSAITHEFPVVYSSIAINGLISNIEDQKDWLYGHVMFYLFKRYAEIETKILEPHKKIRDINCKYLNEIDLPITYIDSRWFTTIVKSEGFKVRGHFRFQPFGVGLKDRKIIWIEDFEKHGYTAKARKLNL